MAPWLRAAPAGFRNWYTRRQRHRRPSLNAGLPSWMLTATLAVLFALLAFAILVEPLRHRDQLPYMHPPGTPPVVTR